MVDAVQTANAAAPLASSQITETYNWSGRQRAQFDADMNAQAKATGTDKISLGFKDFVDMLNPLQHIPVVSNLYQSVTGDNDMKPAVKTVGDAIYGGPIGAVSSVFDAIFKQASGNDAVTTVANWMGLGDDKTTATQTASNSNANTATTPTAPTVPVTTEALNAATTAAQKPVMLASAAQVSQANGDVISDANPPPANSQFFQKLEHSAAPQGTAPTAASGSQQKFFNQTAKQFSGVTPASFRPSKDIANTPASIGLQASSQMNDLTQAAAKSSNAAIQASMAQAGNSAPATAVAGDTVQNPQSDFAQKMMAAMDRYEAAKKTGDMGDAPTVSQGL